MNTVHLLAQNRKVTRKKMMADKAGYFPVSLVLQPACTCISSFRLSFCFRRCKPSWGQLVFWDGYHPVKGLSKHTLSMFFPGG